MWRTIFIGGLLGGIILCLGGASASTAVPTAVQLGIGRIAKHHWAVVSTQDNGYGGVNRPCLRVTIEPVHRASPSSSADIPVGGVNCGSLRPTPDLLSVVDELDHPKVTVLAMAFIPQAHEVTLYFAGRSKRDVELKLLSRRKSHKAGLVPFRYATLAFAGNTCVTRFVVHYKNGEILNDGGRMRCLVHSAR